MRHKTLAETRQVIEARTATALFEPVGDLTPVANVELCYRNQEWAKVA